MLPLHPDDSCPSKSRYLTNFFSHGGTEYTLEVRSEYTPEAQYRLGELILWKGDNGTITTKLVEEDGWQ